MSVTYDNNLKSEVAKNFVNQFGPQSNNKFYIAIAGIHGDPIVSHTPESELNVRNNIVLANRIDPNNGAAVLLRRYDWSNGITMDQYSSSKTVQEYSRPFYVMTNDNNVYLCINNGGGTGSSIQPTGIGTDEIVLSDGYRWKFMYTVPDALTDFITDTFIPAQQLPTYSRIANAYSDLRQNQYAVQYEGSLSSASGRIEAVSISTLGGVFAEAISEKPTNKIVASSSNTVVINSTPTSGQLNGLAIRILSGVAAGAVRVITSNVSGTITLSEEWEANKRPEADDRYEIGVPITISGDGSGALAFGKVRDTDSKIDSIVVYATGSGYSTATATINTATMPTFSGDAYVLDALLFASVGEDPISTLGARHAGIIGKLSGIDPSQSAILGNDFKDVLLWKNPKIGKDKVNAGEVAGFDDTLKTPVIISEASSTDVLTDLTKLNDSTTEIIVFGETSKISSTIDDSIIISSTARTGSFTARDLKRPFIEDEVLVFIGKDNTTTRFTQSEKTALNYVTRYDDSTLSRARDAYDCTLNLTIDFGVNGTYTPTLDGIATGASGSQGYIARFIPTEAGGAEGILSLSDVSDTSGSTFGFVVGETITYPDASGADISGTISRVSGPELNLFTGELPYIKGLSQGITRVAEQDEVFRFIFEF